MELRKFIARTIREYLNEEYPSNDIKKSLEKVVNNYPDSELARQDGNTIGLNKITTVDGEDIYIQAIEFPGINLKPVNAWSSKGENVASAIFRENSDGTWYSTQSETNNSMYRKGIMSAIYDLAEKSIGKIVGSKDQSPSAIKFWEKRKKNI